MGGSHYEDDHTRDMFAGLAMAAILNKSSGDLAQISPTRLKQVAATSFDIAGAMLKEGKERAEAREKVAQDSDE